MFRTELTSFTVKNGENSYTATAPMSLFSVLTENGALENPYYRDESDGRFSALHEACEIAASFTLSSDAARLGYAFLEVPDLDVASEIIFNGKAEFSVSSGRQHRLDISEFTRAGENTVLIKVAASDEPRDLTLLGGIKFIAFEHAHIADISAKPVFVSNSVSVNVALEFVGNPTDVKAVATLVSPSGKIYYGGVTNGTALINVPDPLLWWPGKYGVQNLYKLSVNLYYESEIIDSREVKIGLRSVFLDERSPAGFTVNGAEFLAMGAEYVMSGVTPAFLASSRAKTLIPLAAKANMNFIRYRGEGRYPCDAFLDLCDSYGLAVEFVLKSDKLERGEENSFRRELAYNLRRLSRHPSVISIAYESSSLSERYKNIINEVRSSALSTILVRMEDENDVFRLPPSVPDLKTLASVLEPEDMNIFSYVMERHTASAEMGFRMLRLGAEQYKYASGMDELIYMSGILQAHAAETYARQMRASRSAVGSAVLGALNDSSPSISSATVDFAMRPKPVQYLAARFFAPVCVFPEKTEGGDISFILSNESKSTFSGSLEYAVRDRENKLVYKNSVEVSIDKLSAGIVHTDALAAVIEGKAREYYLDYSLVGDRGCIMRAAHLFVPPKHFRFVDPGIRCDISGSGRDFVLTYSAAAFAKDVVFGFTDTDAEFDENCVDVTDAIPSRIRFVTATETTSERLMSELSVRSVFDIGRIR